MSSQSDKAKLISKGESFDKEIYGESNQYTNYIDEEKDDEDTYIPIKQTNQKLNSYTAPKEVIDDIKAGHHDDPFADAKLKKISEREDKYHQRKRLRQLSPERHDPLKDSDKTPNPNARTYKEIMMEQALENQQKSILKQISKVQEDAMKIAQEKKSSNTTKRKKNDDSNKSVISAQTHSTKLTKNLPTTNNNIPKNSPSDWDKMEKISTSSKWDTPSRNNNLENTPVTPGRRKRWDLTPMEAEATPGARRKTVSGVSGIRGADTPTPGKTPSYNNKMGETPNKGKTKWDETPLRQSNSQTSPNNNLLYGATPTPQGAFNMPTPSPGILHSGLTPWNQLTPERIQLLRLEREIDERNKPFTDEELDQLLPLEGYEIVKPPDNYKPITTPARKLMSTPTPFGSTPLYQMPDGSGKPYEIAQTPQAGAIPGAMPQIKPEDVGYFSALLNEVDESKLTPEELRDRKLMILLLKVKNGTPPMRKSALRQLTEKAREFGAGPLFNQILPLLMSPTLEDQERHLLVKVIDRILYKLDDLVRPYVHKILVVIEPLLIDEDYYARVEGREIISNLAKAAGLATMISTMRPDIDHNDEYVRNTTARAFAVVASALGIPSLLPFLKAVCQSKKSWQARHTGIKIIQQIAILMGCAILPHLKSLVEIIEHGLKDEQQKVRTITALSMAALAEASTPYGIEAFDTVVRTLFEGIRLYRGKGLASFLKAIGYIIPLMDAEHASGCTKLVIPALRREFSTPDEEMKKIILKVVKQCVGTEGVESSFVISDIIPDFFKYFWTRRMALDRKNYKQLVDTTVEVATKVGGAIIIARIVEDLKDENEPLRKMVLETIEKIVGTLGVADISSKLEEQLMDGIIYAFQQQVSEDTQIILNGFGTVVNCLGLRVKPYFTQICGNIQFRLNNHSARIRQQAADLISQIAGVMKTCGEETLMGKLGVVLYEYLGEEYPEVLGSILGALKAIVNVIGISKMTPPIKDLLPRLTPILKNRHEKVQENCIDLVGRIADRGSTFVSAKEWMRICFDLLDLLKAHKKGIRRATVNTFGYIARAIGPQDVLVTLLNNLKVQERQNRVCTTVAIAIVSETCGPFTVIPALMNEYRVPELNVQNGVLKSFSFMFEYIGEMAKDYIYAIIPLLEDALTDRDLVHRQTAAAAVKHLSLGVAGLNCEDGLTHLLNFVWPNIFETSPHVINAVMEAVEGLRVGLGASRLMHYVVQGLFHPARRVRDVYWKIFNMLYIGAADALVASYPFIPDNSQKNQFRRTELELFI